MIVQFSITGKSSKVHRFRRTNKYVNKSIESAYYMNGKSISEEVYLKSLNHFIQLRENNRSHQTN